jgi:hypothetical protein
MSQTEPVQTAPSGARLSRAICILRWCVGIVILIESSLFVFSPARAHDFARSGLPHLVRPILGGAEIIATLLFLIPATRLAGGRALLAIFVAAALIHISMASRTWAASSSTAPQFTRFSPRRDPDSAAPRIPIPC